MSETSVSAGYFDGQSAMERPVELEFLIEGLSFEWPAGVSHLWHYETLKLVSLQRDNGHVTLGWREDDSLRLRIKHAVAGEELFRLAPQLGRTPRARYSQAGLGVIGHHCGSGGALFCLSNCPAGHHHGYAGQLGTAIG